MGFNTAEEHCSVCAERIIVDSVSHLFSVPAMVAMDLTNEERTKRTAQAVAGMKLKQLFKNPTLASGRFVSQWGFGASNPDVEHSSAAGVIQVLK